MKLYSVAKCFFSLQFKTMYKLKVTGLENVPKEGGVVFCPNHISNWDPPLLTGTTKRNVRYMAKDTMFKNKYFAILLKSLGTFPVNREKEDRKALKTAIGLLKSGEALGVFPEGTRSKTGEMGEAKSGASYFALKANAVVIPVFIKGDYKLFSPLEITYGKPVDLSEFENEKVTGETLEKATNKIMEAIKELKK